MNATLENKRLKSPLPGRRQNRVRKFLIPIVVVLLLVGSGFGYFYWTQQAAAASAQVEDEGFKTTRVREGSIRLSASGSGTLTAGQERTLSFSTTGVVAEVNVQVGDVVTQGQELAKLDDLDELQAAVNAAQQELISAQQALVTLKASAPANLASAQIAVADAEEARLDAKSGVIVAGMARCDQETIDAYYYQYTHAKENLDALGDGGGNANYYLTAIVPVKNTVVQAYAAYEYCAGFADYEVSSSEANLALTEANHKQAQAKLAALTENDGLDPLELATCENQVSAAQLALDQAKKKLEGATLKAPFDGTILSVAGQVGDTASTGAFITIADLAHPLIEFSVDETDMDKLAIGQQATVSFDAVVNRTFQGKVTRINPALESLNGYQVVKGLIELDMSQETDVPRLPKGLNASVELLQASAQDVLLVPVQALRDLGDGTFAVFVVAEDGQPRMRMVEVGLMDVTSVEIKSGVSLGDIVTTGIAETNNEVSNGR